MPSKLFACLLSQLFDYISELVHESSPEAPTHTARMFSTGMSQKTNMFKLLFNNFTAAISYENYFIVQYDN